MTQFPLSDNLGDAWRARREGYAGTISDARLTRFAGDRHIVVLAAAASLAALSALTMPVVGVERQTDNISQSALTLPMLGYRYPGVWLVLAAVLCSALVAVAALTWSGGPAARRPGNHLLVAVSTVLALIALAGTLFLFAHTADLARAALAVSSHEPGAFLLPKGGHWHPGPLWPFTATPGLALWTCAGAVVTSLATVILLAARLLVRSVRSRFRGASLSGW